jgi:hypothetical protein
MTIISGALRADLNLIMKKFFPILDFVQTSVGIAPINKHRFFKMNFSNQNYMIPTISELIRKISILDIDY